jgi:hypothetical protein
VHKCAYRCPESQDWRAFSVIGRTKFMHSSDYGGNTLRRCVARNAMTKIEYVPAARAIAREDIGR